MMKLPHRGAIIGNALQYFTQKKFFINYDDDVLFNNVGFS